MGDLFEFELENNEPGFYRNTDEHDSNDAIPELQRQVICYFVDGTFYSACQW